MAAASPPLSGRGRRGAAPEAAVVADRCRVNLLFGRPAQITALALVCSFLLISNGASARPLGQLASATRRLQAAAAAEAAAAEADATIADSGWRAAWVDGFDMGKGFIRETGQLANTAIKYTPQEGHVLVTSPQFSYSLLSTSSDYSKMVTAGGSASFEGWGASGSASYKSLSSLHITTKDLTAMASMVYLSDPVTIIDPANEMADVGLTPSAIDYMQNHGPVAWHAKYGSHFISGYTKGGSFSGAYVMSFDDVESAEENSASIRASYSSWGMKAEGSAEFEQQVKSKSGFEKVTATYDCYGWSSEFPPKLVTTLDNLVEASGQFRLQDGRQMEAILKRYSDIDSYNTAKANYMDANPDAPDYQYLYESSYGRLRAALNAEYMRYVFMTMILEDETDPVLRQVYDNATAVMRQYTRAFGGVEQANATLAHDNLVALEAYLLTFEMQPPDPDTSSDEERRLYDEGEKLYDKLWQADELEDALDVRLKQLGQAIPSVLGPSNMKPWNLNFNIAPQAEFIWGMAGADLGLDISSSLYTFTRNYTLDNPAALTLSIFVDDYCNFFLNNKFIGASAYPGWLHRDNPAQWDTFHLGAHPAGDLAFVLRCSNALYRTNAGLLAALTNDADNSVLLVTDREWRVSTGDSRITISPDDIAAMPAATALGGLGLWGEWNPIFPADPGAQWLWAFPYNVPDAVPSDTLYTFYNNVTMLANSTAAILTVGVDDAADVYLNGIFVGTKIGGWNDYWGANWAQSSWPVTLQGGPNTLAVRCNNVWGGPAGLLVALTAHNFTTGQDDLLLQSDGTWKYTSTQAYNPPM